MTTQLLILHFGLVISIVNLIPVLERVLLVGKIHGEVVGGAFLDPLFHRRMRVNGVGGLFLVSGRGWEEEVELEEKSGEEVELGRGRSCIMSWREVGAGFRGGFWG